MSSVRRRLLERRLKEMLLDQAQRAGLGAERLAEWLYEEHGVRARPDWRSVRRAALSSPVTAQELAAFLIEEGVEVDEDAWLRVLKEYSIGNSVPRLPGSGGAEARGGRGRRGEAEG